MEYKQAVGIRAENEGWTGVNFCGITMASELELGSCCGFLLDLDRKDKMRLHHETSSMLG